MRIGLPAKIAPKQPMICTQPVMSACLSAGNQRAERASGPMNANADAAPMAKRLSDARKKLSVAWKHKVAMAQVQMAAVRQALRHIDRRVDRQEVASMHRHRKNSQ